MKIGQLSAKSHVPIKTIRYYEEIGLLPIPDRNEGNFRLFSPENISRLLFIKRLQLLGLSLQEIKECLTVFDRGELPCADLQVKLKQHVKTIDLQIQDMMALRQQLCETLQNWDESPIPQANIICPNLQA
ncbi:heavy metal-responsive transcriptional regulator [Chamaesiphon sp.]|uniref:heavy metal-responsive transcriptional regulator n=1 Tax=Chamaesiphon sp. TaxID=2814140 RepID=UPI003593F3E3